MTIEWIKIHPAIGIARLGNSPDEYFIGPEVPGDRSIPPGGYKDSKCRIKRQAAQFHIFAHHSDGSATEIQSDIADITWTVHLVNKKASVNDRNVAKPGEVLDPNNLVIDPGAKTLTGPNQSKLFDTGKIKFSASDSVVVPLGEIRTDGFSRLIVLGGFGVSDSPGTHPIHVEHFCNNPGWYDDTSDGPVTATVKFHGTDKVYEAEQAWVIVAPPKFAPGIDNIVTLYDRLIDSVDPPLPTYASYMSDIYPILERAKNTNWVVDNSGSHTWPHPVIDPELRMRIFNRLTSPDATEIDMPRLNAARLTRIQYRLMELWKDGLFKNDWKTPPADIKSITPDGLDRAALENAVGDAFYPGIEAGGIVSRPIIDNHKIVNLFRFNDLVKPGDITAFMAIPWQADFKSCGANWWPVPRPNQVIPKGTTSYQQWDRDVGTWKEMVNYWHTLGFIVREGEKRVEGEKHVEVDVCPRPSITLVTPHRDFKDTSQGPMGMTRQNALPIVFEVRSTETPVTLEFDSAPSHPRLNCLEPTITVGPTKGNEVATARLWITYETGPLGEVLTDLVVIRNRADRKTWSISITANTVPRRHNVVALVLERSQYMSDITGDGQSKYMGLQQASSTLVDTMLEGDGLALVSFDENAEIVMPTTVLGPPSDTRQAARDVVKNFLAGLLPTGGCSILDGIHQGQKILKATGVHYGVKTLLVVSSGRQGDNRMTSRITTDFNEQIYSICLGSGQETNVNRLREISSNNKGYMLIKDDSLKSNQFKVQKYFLQIVGQVNGSGITKEFQGEILPGKRDTVPLLFYITEADSGIDVIVLTAHSGEVDLFLITPNGFLIGPQNVGSKISYTKSTGLNYYRILLPVELEPARLERGGTWQVFLRSADSKLVSGGSMLYNSGLSSEIKNTQRSEHLQNGINAESYYLTIHSYSSLTFHVWLYQTSYQPGGSMFFEASLFQADAPLSTTTYVWAEITRPDGTCTSIKFHQSEQSRFSAEFNMTLPGVYYARVRCNGRSRLGYPFQREQSLTASVWHSALT